MFVLKTIAHFCRFDEQEVLGIRDALGDVVAAMLLSRNDKEKSMLSHSTVTIRVNGYNLIPNSHRGEMDLWRTESSVEICVLGERGSAAITRKVAVYHYKPSVGEGSSFLSSRHDGEAEIPQEVFRKLFE